MVFVLIFTSLQFSSMTNFSGTKILNLKTNVLNYMEAHKFYCLIKEQGRIFNTKYETVVKIQHMAAYWSETANAEGAL